MKPQKFKPTYTAIIIKKQSLPSTHVHTLKSFGEEISSLLVTSLNKTSNTLFANLKACLPSCFHIPYFPLSFKLLFICGEISRKSYLPNRFCGTYFDSLFPIPVKYADTYLPTSSHACAPYTDTFSHASTHANTYTHSLFIILYILFLLLDHCLSGVGVCEPFNQPK